MWTAPFALLSLPKNIVISLEKPLVGQYGIRGDMMHVQSQFGFGAIKGYGHKLSKVNYRNIPEVRIFLRRVILACIQVKGAKGTAYGDDIGALGPCRLDD